MVESSNQGNQSLKKSPTNTRQRSESQNIGSRSDLGGMDLSGGAVSNDLLDNDEEMGDEEDSQNHGAVSQFELVNLENDVRHFNWTFRSIKLKNDRKSFAKGGPKAPQSLSMKASLLNLKNPLPGKAYNFDCIEISKKFINRHKEVFRAGQELTDDVIESYFIQEKSSEDNNSSNVGFSIDAGAQRNVYSELSQRSDSKSLDDSLINICKPIVIPDRISSDSLNSLLKQRIETSSNFFNKIKHLEEFPLVKKSHSSTCLNAHLNQELARKEIKPLVYYKAKKNLDLLKHKGHYELMDPYEDDAPYDFAEEYDLLKPNMHAKGLNSTKQKPDFVNKFRLNQQSDKRPKIIKESALKK